MNIFITSILLIFSFGFAQAFGASGADGAMVSGPGNSISIYVQGERYSSFNEYLAQTQQKHILAAPLMASQGLPLEKLDLAAFGFREINGIEGLASCYPYGLARNSGSRYLVNIPEMAGQDEPSRLDGSFQEPFSPAYQALYGISIDRSIQEARKIFDGQPGKDPLMVSSKEELEQKIDEVIKSVSGPILMVARGGRVRLLKVKDPFF